MYVVVQTRLADATHAHRHDFRKVISWSSHLGNDIKSQTERWTDCPVDDVLSHKVPWTDELLTKFNNFTSGRSCVENVESVKKKEKMSHDYQKRRLRVQNIPNMLRNCRTIRQRYNEFKIVGSTSMTMIRKVRRQRLRVLLIEVTKEYKENFETHRCQRITRREKNKETV